MARFPRARLPAPGRRSGTTAVPRLDTAERSLALCATIRTGPGLLTLQSRRTIRRTAAGAAPPVPAEASGSGAARRPKPPPRWGAGWSSRRSPARYQPRRRSRCRTSARGLPGCRVIRSVGARRHPGSEPWTAGASSVPPRMSGPVPSSATAAPHGLEGVRTHGAAAPGPLRPRAAGRCPGSAIGPVRERAEEASDRSRVGFAPARGRSGFDFGFVHHPGNRSKPNAASTGSRWGERKEPDARPSGVTLGAGLERDVAGGLRAGLAQHRGRTARCRSGRSCRDDQDPCGGRPGTMDRCRTAGLGARASCRGRPFSVRSNRCRQGLASAVLPSGCPG